MTVDHPAHPHPHPPASPHEPTGDEHRHALDHHRHQDHVHGPEDHHPPGAANSHSPRADHQHDHSLDHIHAHERERAHGSDHDHDHDHEHTHPHDGWWASLKHLFQPHSHDAADSLDNALAGSAAGIRAVKVSLVGLAVTAVLQLVIVYFSGSVALLADTIHNFADASTAIPLWIAFSIGRRRPTRRYTYGFGRAEDLAGVFIVLMIAASAALAGWESFNRLLYPQPVQFLGWVALAGFIGFLGNEAVAQYRIRVGQRIGSAALVADGYHARTDGFTSLAVLFGAAGVWLGFPQADPLVGLGITVAILLILKDAARQVWHRLMDAVEPDLLERAEQAALATEGVQGVAQVRARWIGHAIHADALITANCEITLAEAHAIAERARHAMLHAVPKLADVTVHVDPCSHTGLDPHADLAHHEVSFTAPPREATLGRGH